MGLCGIKLKEQNKYYNQISAEVVRDGSILFSWNEEQDCVMFYTEGIFLKDIGIVSKTERPIHPNNRLIYKGNTYKIIVQLEEILEL